MHIKRAKSDPSYQNLTQGAHFAIFHTLSGLYLWNRLVDFGSVNCIGKVFFRALRRVETILSYD